MRNTIQSLAFVLSCSIALAGCSHRVDTPDEPIAAQVQAATAIEYGLIAALVAVVIIGALTALGDALTTTFEDVATEMEGAQGGAQGGSDLSCLAMCQQALDSALPQCTDQACIDAAIAQHAECTEACPEEDPPTLTLPLLALQYNADADLSLPAKATLEQPDTFLVPEAIPIAYGRSGEEGSATLSWTEGRGQVARCDYTGDGNRYIFNGCTDSRMRPGDTFETDLVGLDITPGDPSFLVTTVGLDLSRPRVRR